MKLNRKGFTLIELLAVITIMGILMIVAIPAVSRTIENSRKDTFLNTAKQYANEVKTQWASDNVTCNILSGTPIKASSTSPNSTFSILIDTKENDTSGEGETKNQIGYSNAKLLIEQGGKSSWGNSNVKGYVTIKTGTSSKEQKYFVQLIDEKNRGIIYDPANRVESNKLKRNAVSIESGRTFENAFYQSSLSLCEIDE